MLQTEGVGKGREGEGEWRNRTESWVAVNESGASTDSSCNEVIA